MKILDLKLVKNKVEVDIDIKPKDWDHLVNVGIQLAMDNDPELAELFASYAIECGMKSNSQKKPRQKVNLEIGDRLMEVLGDVLYLYEIVDLYRMSGKIYLELLDIDSDDKETFRIRKDSALKKMFKVDKKD